MEADSCSIGTLIKTDDPELVRRSARPEGTIVDVNGIKIGGKEIVIMAGPCAVETEEQLSETAKSVRAGGASLLRGGAFKPRTSPYSFQGLGKEGLEMLERARNETGLSVVSEVMDTRQVETVARYVDMLQIGSRNMQNFPLLKEAGRTSKPILLKRGMMATIDEYLHAAEYLLSQGNTQVVLCERGIRTFESSTRYTLDLNAIPVLKQRTHLPVIVDPSHGTGVRSLVPTMAKASLAAGADGLLMEVHYRPEEALCDGSQSLYPEEFGMMMGDLRKIAEAVGRSIHVL
ncbi:MAG: 3-deoxy-7-phosphoheptulonate synthase [Bacteroidetes bacterium]|nr:MAG: 3-deoxy-7-phosphoheptulonate synthase [Bacteroidota bacterium]RLD94041.1 MAG: 3-deoxy-7-phosphoheptulonate synthase [Bacteroidota bacterium]